MFKICWFIYIQAHHWLLFTFFNCLSTEIKAFIFLNRFSFILPNALLFLYTQMIFVYLWRFYILLWFYIVKSYNASPLFINSLFYYKVLVCVVTFYLHFLVFFSDFYTNWKETHIRDRFDVRNVTYFRLGTAAVRALEIFY